MNDERKHEDWDYGPQYDRAAWFSAGLVMATLVVLWGISQPGVIA